MQSRSLLCAALLAGAVPLSAQSPNPGTPPGTQGHDWDSVAFRLDRGQIAVVTAVNVSTGGNTNSTSGFEVFLDGARLDAYTVNGIIATRSYVVPAAGRHNVLVRCTNHVADMSACRVAAIRVDEGLTL